MPTSSDTDAGAANAYAAPPPPEKLKVAFVYVAPIGDLGWTWAHDQGRLMLAVHPARGLDIGVTELVRNLLLEQRENGAAILLISEDLEELLALSDRIAVMYEGEIMGIVPTERADIKDIGLMMAGSKR